MMNPLEGLLTLNGATLKDDYTPHGSPRASQRRLDNMDTLLKDIRSTLDLIAGIAKDHDLEVAEVKERLDGMTSTLRDVSKNQDCVNDMASTQSSTLVEILAQLKMLVTQFSRLETARLEEIARLQYEMAQLKTTVHNELVATREMVKKELRSYICRDTVTYEL